MKKFLLTVSLAAIASGGALAQPVLFQPGQLAVLQEGDGGTNRCLPLGAKSGITNYAASDIAGSRQTQYFIDQFDPNGLWQTHPVIQVAVPTNEASGLFVNGNAGTEGGLTLAGNKSVLAFTGYAGQLLSITTGSQTAPSNLSYDRGIGTLDAFGNYTQVYRGGAWYGIATGKTNPRGVATDGFGQFWGCGNGYGSLYYDAHTGDTPSQFQNIDLTSCIKVLNHAVYTSVKAGDVQNGLYPAGVYSFVDNGFNPVPYPNFLTFLQLYLQAQPPFTNCIGFDINPQGTVAYVADVGSISKGVIVEPGGIQKYVKNGLAWNLAYNLVVPGYTNQTSGILADPGSTNVPIGCFSVTVDWSGPNPVVYATTADCGVDSGDPYYGNRVIRINDTNTATSGANIIVTTNLNILTTVAHPGLDANGSVITNIVYKSVAFTPDLRPVITTNPVSWSAASGDSVDFDVSASSLYPLHYQWLENGTNLNGRTASSLTLNPVATTDNGSIFQCVVANDYGSVTSSVATLTVSASPTSPSLGGVASLSSYIGNSVTINANATGTDPKSYTWYFNGTALSDGSIGDGAIYVGSTSGTLTINNAQAGEAGVFSVRVSNSANSASNAVASLALTYAPPAIVVPPAATTAFLGQNLSLNVSAYDGTVNGSSLSYQWYTGKANGTGLTALSDTGEYSGSASSTLNITGAVAQDATNYVVVVSNSGGSVTSPPVALALLVQPPHSFVFYNSGGAVYTQNFNSLPINGGSSADAANPVSILEMTNYANLVANSDPGVVGVSFTYSLANPFDFAYPIIPQGFVGGLGLGNTLPGWYGWSSASLKFGATYGDQSAGGIIDNGQNYLGDGAPLGSITNRALGMISTTKSGTVAYGVALINNTSQTLRAINLSYVGELWRNNPNAQVIAFGYGIDPAGTNSTFNPGLMSLNPVTNLDVAFPTNAVTQITDGTQASNQVNLAVSFLSIGDWTPGSTLWLVWQSQNPAGGAQGLAIDDLSFSAVSGPTLTIERVGANVVISWPESFTGGTLVKNADLAQPDAWSSVGPVVPVNGLNTVTVPLTSTNQFFELIFPPGT